MPERQRQYAARVDRRPPYPPDFQLILASQSPRRHSLLRDIGVPFTVVSSQAEELTTGGDARVLAEKNAAAKVRSASPLGAIPPGAFVLGTDTLVTIDGVVMGKPASAAKAREMLAALAGRTHEVVSGVALLRTPEAVCPPGTGASAGAEAARPLGAGASAGAEAGLGAEAVLEALRVASTVTEVTFEPLAAAQIDAYVASGEGKGKAGAYAVQGLAALFVSGVRGEYSNVVGLPLCLLNGMFRELGFDLLRREWLW